MTLDEIYKLYSFYLRKSPGGGFLSPEEMDRVTDRAQIQYFEKIKPAYGTTSDIAGALVPFKKTFVFTNSTSPNGLVTFPDDFLHLLAIVPTIMDNTTVRDVILDELQEDKIAARTNSQLDPPSKYPFFIRFAGKTCQLWPKVPAAGTVYYLRKPAKPQYVYTLTNGRPVYNPDTSVQLEWNEAATEEIIWIALGLLGIQTQDSGVIQLSQAKEAAAK